MANFKEMIIFATLFIPSSSVNTYYLSCSQIIAILWIKITDGILFHEKHKFHREMWEILGMVDKEVIVS